jgi:hypothetical protein
MLDNKVTIIRAIRQQMKGNLLFINSLLIGTSKIKRLLIVLSFKNTQKLDFK